MRVHIFTLRLKERGGGSHQNVIAFTRVLKAAGHSVTFHTMFADNEPPADITVQCENAGGSSFFALQRVCAEAMKRSQSDADVFLVYGQALLWAGGLYRKSGTVPVATYLDSHLDSMKEAFRGTGAFHRLTHFLWERVRGLSLARHVDRYLVVSPYLLERYARVGFPKEKCTVLPNAFDFREPERRAHEVPCILFVGRLSFEKSPDLFVTALAHVHERWRARIVGDGPMRQEIEAHIRSLGLSGRAEIAGWKNTSELAHEYAAADLFVLPSRVPEPFGRTVVEAMHAGLPVVVPRVGGAAWVAGDASITFQNGDAASLCAAISQLLSDAEMRKALGEKGRVRAQAFAKEIVGAQLVAELQSLVLKQK